MKPDTWSNITREVGGNVHHHIDYYEVLTSRHFQTKEEQSLVRRAEVLFAGVGSVGGNMAYAWAEAGGENLVMCDPDTVGIENLTGQRFTTADIGNNKAEARFHRFSTINPWSVEGSRVESDGITHENVERLVAGSDIVVDGIDITALDMIYELHVQAAKQKKPVIVGYDLAGTAMLVVYRYDLDDREPLDGELSIEDIAEFNTVKAKYIAGEIGKDIFLDYVLEKFKGPINPLHVPVEQLEALVNRQDGEMITPQDPNTPKVLGALFVETARRILLGEAVKNVIYSDIPSLVRSRNPRFISKLILMYRALGVLSQRKNNVMQELS